MKCLTILAVAAVLLTGFCPPETKKKSQSSRKNISALRAEKPSPLKIEHSSKQAGFDSPKAVFAAYEQAVKNEDYSAYVRCYSPEVQEWMVAAETLAAITCIEFLPEEDVKEFVDLMVKHGFNDESEGDELPLKTCEDRVAYLTDLFEWACSIDEFEEMFDVDEMWSTSPGALGEVKIDGDKATATVTYPDNQAEEINFIQIDGKWFAIMPGFEH